MIPDRRFTFQSREFWANVRAISQIVGYTVRGKKQVKVPSLSEICRGLKAFTLSCKHIDDDSGLTEFGSLLLEYFEYRAEVLNGFVEPRLMDAERARRVFEDLRVQLRPQCPIPMNKQKAAKRAPAFLTGIVNMLIENNANGFPCDYDPRTLTTVTRDGVPLRTLARRVDGAFPSAVNPIAVWEIKEYYYTTTFGSRVADGLYETLLDGMELQELNESEKIHVRHYMMLDAHFTWWVCGKSYLCRVVDLLHMGYADEILFGYEVVERLPSIVQEWLNTLRDIGG